MISYCVAFSENLVIGVGGTLPWHLPLDFKRFKDLTMGNYMIMGRKTFESLPGGPLPKRTHVIVTRQKNYTVPAGCLVAHSLEDAIRLCPKDQETFIIGGGDLFRLGLEQNVVDRMYTTVVRGEFSGDAFFPQVDYSGWKLLEERHFTQDAKHAYAFTFYTWERKRASSSAVFSC